MGELCLSLSYGIYLLDWNSGGRQITKRKKLKYPFKPISLFVLCFSQHDMSHLITEEAGFSLVDYAS